MTSLRLSLTLSRDIVQRWWFYPVLAAIASALLLLVLLVFGATLVYPSLPSLEVLTDYQPKIPLRVYSAEGTLLGEFGEERRELVKINDVPDLMKKAILAAEDDRFYEHGAVDFSGMLRAAFFDFTSGDARQGASTITMQVARNFFLSNEKTLTRKFKEVLLALEIEHHLSKDEILQLYINQIYLGQHSYGFAAATQVGSSSRAAVDCRLSRCPAHDRPTRSARVLVQAQHRRQPGVGCRSGGTVPRTRGWRQIQARYLSNRAASPGSSRFCSLRRSQQTIPLGLHGLDLLEK